VGFPLGIRGEGERFVIFPLTFSLFPPLAKVLFARGLLMLLAFLGESVLDKEFLELSGLAALSAISI
jgi:hypothetical protein